jgi:hypothetical protein
VIRWNFLYIKVADLQGTFHYIRDTDPLGFKADPDPAFQVNAEPDADADPDADPGDPDSGFDDQKCKKITAEKKLYIFLITNCNLLIPRPP